MVSSIRKRDDLENLHELISLGSQVKAIELQYKLGKQKFLEDMEKIFKPVSKSVEDVSEEVTKTKTETSIKNNKALENINNKLEILIDMGLLASCLLSPLAKIANPEHISHFRLVKDPNSNRVNDFLLK